MDDYEDVRKPPKPRKKKKRGRPADIQPNHTMDDYEEHLKKPPKPRKKQKQGRPADDYDNKISKPSTQARRISSIILASAKPSYCLRRGIGSLHQVFKSLRSENRRKLRSLLQTLLLQHRFGEASGVLSVLLKGTVKEKALFKTRVKFRATLELLEHIKGDTIRTRKMPNVYELWMKKLGPLKRWHMKDRCAVQLEFILSCLKFGKTEDAHQAALCVMQDRGFETDAVSNLVVGLTFYQLWYSDIPKELHLQDLDGSDGLVQSETLEDRIDMSILNSEEHDAVEGEGDNSLFHLDSNTSIRNDKEIPRVDVTQQQTKVPTAVYDNVKGETQSDNSKSRDSYIHSAERSDSEGSFMDHSDDVPYHSIFYTRLPLWLLPIRLPSSNENLEDRLSMHRTLRNDHYKSAIKHLRQALYSSPPSLEAFHPLIQVLLLGDQVKEALDEVENFSPYSNTSFQLRLKAAILEHFDSSNYAKLSTVFEENMEKDPTCSYSLRRLISLHRNGEYSTEKLVEMIALHLDAIHAKHDTWKEFACCLMKLSQCEEECMSVCSNGGEDSQKQKLSSQISQMPRIFRDYESSNSWRLRCRWWLTRHFSQNILASDIASGDRELLTYKAATACYLYGQKFMYVANAMECLKEEPSNKTMSSILEMHANTSTGFYFNGNNK